MNDLKNYIPKACLLGAGFICGGVIGYMTAKYRYARNMEREVEEIKTALSKYYVNQSSEEKTVDEQIDEADTVVENTETTEEAEEKEYVDYTAYFNGPDVADDEVVVTEDMVLPNPPGDKPYIIHPNEFGCVDGYGIVTINFFKDHILLDTDDDPIEDVDGTIGVESLNHFGEYDDEAVYVRNDKTMCDYEIIKHDVTADEFYDSKARKGVL